MALPAYLVQRAALASAPIRPKPIAGPIVFSMPPRLPTIGGDDHDLARLHVHQTRLDLCLHPVRQPSIPGERHPRRGVVAARETRDPPFESQDSFADGRTRTATALVGLYRALAGGWPARLPEREQVSAR